MNHGVLNVYKEKGFTSHDVVAKIRGLLGTKKVGHTGTLDPQATGVLPILVGNAAKALDLIPDHSKTYRATLRFGLSTDTEDIWGKKRKEDAARPTLSQLEEAMERFRGVYMQTPPMVSAVKVGGKKLYEYARQGIEIERPARPVTIESFTLLSFTGEQASFRVAVSKGTYIRTLLVDLCREMGVLGAMSELEREKSGIFTVQNALTLSQLEQMTKEERQDQLLPVEQLFLEYPMFSLPPFFDRLIANGCAVLCEKLNLSEFPAGQRFRLYRDGTFFALGEIREEDGQNKLCAIKHFPSNTNAKK